MISELYRWMPAEGVKIVVVLFLSFLTGLEREERKSSADHYTFGGVRTFPLIGLIGYAVALLAGGQLLPVAAGFAVVGAFLLVSYRHKLATAETAGVTTEMSGLATYLVGALVYHEQFWIATTLSVAGMLLLELKAALENLARRASGGEILTFTKFLLLTAVILPVLPNQGFGPFLINPFKTWLVVVAVSAVSYGSYVIQKVTGGHGGVTLAAILGGAYSSTVTTVVMARRSRGETRPHLFAGGMLMACGMMYLRLAALVALFNAGLLSVLGAPFLALAAAALGSGWLWSRLPDRDSDVEVKREYQPHNPLELRAALFFAALFLLMLVATRLAVSYLGRGGVYGLGAVMGLADVDPFIMGMTQSAGGATPLPLAAAAVLIAAASNNLAKGAYAYGLGGRAAGRQGALLLGSLALAGLLPLLWL